MNKLSKIISGVVVLALLIAFILRSRPDAGSSPPPDVSKGEPTRSTPVAQVVLPTLPAVPAGAAGPTGADADVTTLDNAVADLANLFQNGDIAAVADNYTATPEDRKAVFDTLQRIQAEGIYGQARLHQMGRAFAALATQTPQFRADTIHAIFWDRTIYGQRPPFPLDKLAPGTDPDVIIRIPIQFVKQDGHWYLDGAIGVLYGAVHTASDAEMVEAVVNAKAAGQDSTSH